MTFHWWNGRLCFKWETKQDRELLKNIAESLESFGVRNETDTRPGFDFDANDGD